MFGPDGEGVSAAIGLLVLSLTVLAAAIGLDRLTFDALSGILTLTALVALTMPVLTWLARKEGDPGLATVDLGDARHDWRYPRPILVCHSGI